MRTITKAAVVTIAGHAEKFTDGQFSLKTTGKALDRGVRFIDGRRAVTWYGKDGGSTSAAAYYIGGMLGWAASSGRPIPDDVRALCQEAQAAYVKRGDAPRWEQEGRDDAAARFATVQANKAREREAARANAEYQVRTWLLNDFEFYDTSQERARQDAAGDALRTYVTTLLYPYPVSARGPLSRDTAHNLSNVRASFTRDEFDLIDWADLASGMLG